jgi:hypothetical protein
VIYLTTPHENPVSTSSNQDKEYKSNNYDEPTPNHEPVRPGLPMQNEPTLTGSPKAPGSRQQYENINERDHEPTEPAIPGGTAQKKFTFSITDEELLH